MLAAVKKRSVVENGDGGGFSLNLAATIANGEDLGPIVRHAFESGKPEALSSHLKNIVHKKEAEIEELCKLHYEEFIRAVDELRGVLVDAEELKSMMAAENSHLQDVASSLLSKLEELLELYSIKKNVTEAIQKLKVCVEVSSLCLTCNGHVKEGRFYPALKLLDLIEKEYLQQTPIKAIRRVIKKQVPTLKLHIEKKVCSEFNNWLVYIRSTAREIGQVSIGKAASARQRDEEVRTRQREAEEQSCFGFSDYLCTLDLDQGDEDPALDFNLTPVYHAHHIHMCLGIGEKFRDYYYQNRLMQLNLDLQISTMQPFLESHQPFFSQIAGFFIVEDRVYRTAGDLLTESQVEALWETALSKMTSILEGQFSRLDISSHLLVKDYVTLLCATLRRFGYQVSPLLNILDKSRDKYHALLLKDCQKLIADFLSQDTFMPMVVKKEYEYNMNVLAFHLEPAEGIPDFPYEAPFSDSVPNACRIVRSFTEASVSYLSYGGVMNFFDVVKKYLDKMLIEVLNDGLLSMIHTSSLGVPQIMQIAANIMVLERACDHFLWHAAQLCGVPRRVVERPHSSLAAKAVLKTSENASYNQVLNVVNSKLDEFMALINNINWTVEDASDHANVNDYMNEVLIFLDTVVSSGHRILPLEVLYRVAMGALSHISDYIMAVFLSENLKRFTVSAVSGIDNDLKSLESFAEQRFHSIGLSELRKDATFKDALVECRQLVNLLVSNQPENFINPVIRQKSYGALDHKKVAVICEKLKDSPDRLFGSLSSRNTKQSARKKSMDVLKRRLKDFN